MLGESRSLLGFIKPNLKEVIEMLCLYPISDKCGNVLGYRALSYSRRNNMMYEVILVRGDYGSMLNKTVQAVAPEQLYIARTMVFNERRTILTKSL
jgi:hypothetical protein